MQDMAEVRWHGRAGQGAKTASYMLAEAAMEAGKQIQAFPEYGPERMGAPLKAYTRISSKPIRTHSGVKSPDVVVVLDPTLLKIVDVAEGLSKDGLIVVNTDLSPEEIKKEQGWDDVTVWTLDADTIAMETIGRPFPNTPLLGALAKASGLVDVEVIKERVTKTLGKKRPELLEGNLKAIERAYEEVRSS